MLGIMNLGESPLGSGSFYLEEGLNFCNISIVGFDVEISTNRYFEIDTSEININQQECLSKLKLNMLPNYNSVVLEAFETDRKIIYRAKPNTTYINIQGLPVQFSINQREPSIEQYINYIKTNIRNPIYKIEILRKEDESVYKVIEGEIIDNSGSISNTLDEGVRRTCNFTLPNYDNKYSSLIDELSIGSKFKLYLGYEIDNVKKYFPEGVFVFDDPTMSSMQSDKNIEISGTDKWSMLNGQNGGILEGTYVVEKGSKIGDLIRRTLRLNIVNDPIEPMIDASIENMETTYDITKSAGETVSDIFLEVALNISAYIYYDENGRLQVYPVDNDIYKAPAYTFNKNEYNYLNGTKQYQLSEIYNSVLIIGENIKDTNTPIIYEAINNDLSDQNSVPNVGFKKTKMITEYTKGITTEKLAKERGNWELKKVKAKMSSVDINCVSLYHLDVNQIVVLTDNYLNSQDERFLINSIDLPIGTDVQSTINLVKAVSIE